MADMDYAVSGLAKLIEVVSGGEWSYEVAFEQAALYVCGVRDGQIADVTFQAVSLAKLIAKN